MESPQVFSELMIRTITANIFWVPTMYQDSTWYSARFYMWNKPPEKVLLLSSQARGSSWEWGGRKAQEVMQKSECGLYHGGMEALEDFNAVSNTIILHSNQSTEPELFKASTKAHLLKHPDQNLGKKESWWWMFPVYNPTLGTHSRWITKIANSARQVLTQMTPSPATY